MLPDYSDIRSRITEEPVWFDSNGVPRYDPFHPDDVPDIYADEAILYLIKCQSCAEKFKVAAESGNWQRIKGDPHLATRIKDGRIHYGDPPRHGCVGDTMNCDDIRVLEYWRKESFEWARVAEFEVMLPDGEELVNA